MKAVKKKLTRYLKSILLLLAYLLLVLYMKSIAQNERVPRTYIAYNVLDSLVIDGVANESSWQIAPFSASFIDIEGIKKPKYDTRIKMLWDESYLYIYAQMEEPNIWGDLTQRDTVVFYNNDFEVFIDPDGDTHNYYELEVNSLNTQWDLFLTKPYRNAGKAIDSWDIQGLKTAVAVSGTLNDPSDEDIGWSIEIAMPWSVLTEAASHGGVPKNEFWRINFSRVNWDFQLEEKKYSRKKDDLGAFLPEYNWVWSPQGVINMHEPERWGYVFFSGFQENDEHEFSVPDDEYIKWEMYSWYRKIYKKKDVSLPKALNVLGKDIDLFFEPNVGGWHIWCESPFTGVQLIIEEDGKFRQKE